MRVCDCVCVCLINNTHYPLNVSNFIQELILIFMTSCI